MSDIHIVRDYPHSPAKVWRALTDPALMELWMIAARPVGFRAEVGARFKFVGQPRPGWSGVVDGVVLEVRAPHVLRYSWIADDGDPLELTYRLAPHGDGARFTFDQTGFTGIGGFLLAKVIMTSVRKKMFGVKMPALLDALDEEGKLRPGDKLPTELQEGQAR